MKTIENFLDEISQEYTEKKLIFQQVLEEYKKGNCSFDFIQSIIKPATHLHAKQFCDLQIKACAENTRVVNDYGERDENWSKDIILNTSNVSENIK